MFYGLPWLQWSGRQTVLFDLDAQRFYIFGLLLYPQDLIFLAALLVLSALALFFFTAVAGRLWCGYTCPQTVYRDLHGAERKIEGDRVARMRLDQQPWRWQQDLAQGRQALGVAVDRLVHRVQLRRLLHADPRARSGYGELEPVRMERVLGPVLRRRHVRQRGLLREQMCKYMCPLRTLPERLDRQGLADHHLRREARRPARIALAQGGLGRSRTWDCIDCTLCVQVCPTGIDIRNGLQNECIGCAACIDVCNDVMDKMGYAKGLIRYPRRTAW